MKKPLLTVLTCALILSLCSCTVNENHPPKEQTDVESSLQTESVEESLPPEVSDNTSDIPIAQKIVLIQFYANWAWGFRFEGTFVDNEGNIRAFSLEDNQTYQDIYDGIGLPAYLETLCNQEVIDNLDIRELQYYFQMFPAFYSGQVMEVNTMFDAGTTGLSAVYMDEEGTAVMVDIAFDGDWTGMNDATGTAQLMQWISDKGYFSGYDAILDKIELHADQLSYRAAAEQ